MKQGFQRNTRTIVLLTGWFFLLIMRKSILAFLVLIVAAFLVLPVSAAIGSDTAIIYVTSSPSGATATDSATGSTITTPGSFTVYTTGTPENHYITVSKNGYYDYYYDAGTPVKDDYITVNAILTPIQTDGYLAVSSNPSGANIYVDGVYKGTTAATITVSAGFHTIRLEKSGYDSWSGSANVITGQTTSISGSMTPTVTYGYLYVTSSPSAADVYVNGVYKGDTSFTIGLTPGTYSVVVKKAGYNSYSTTTTVSAGTTTTVSANLKTSADAYIQVASYPAGAAVYIDGTYVGNTQYSTAANPNYMHAGPFTAGTAHTLSLKLDGYNTYSTSFVLSSGETRTITVTMTPVTPVVTTAYLQINSNPAAASVYVDNVFRGYTPLYLSDITSGTHTVLLQHPGYDDWSESDYFSTGQTVERTVVMSAKAVPTPTSSPVPFIGILAGLGACGMVLAARRR